MVIVYHAASTLDAHMIKGLLEQYKIRAYIQGEYLQGGMGELPTIGLVTVSVDNEYQAEACNIVAEWESGTIIEIETNSTLVDDVLSVSS